jgi:uncharacterized protein
LTNINIINKRFYETIFLMFLMLLTVFFFPKIFGIVSILPLIYFFIENRVRKKKDVIFKHKEFLKDLKSSWLPFITVALILQGFYFLIFTHFSPELLSHVKERTTIITSFDIKLVLTLMVLAIIEEIVFRGLFQKRLNLKLNPLYSILITSVVFTLLHISEGSPMVVFVDLTTVFIDSVFFGYLFYKTNNLYVSWLAHSIGNIMAAFLLINFI